MLFTSAPLESVAEAQRRAKKRLPTAVYASLIAGTEKGLTLHDNIQAFDEIGLIPRIAADLPPQREMSTTVMGQEISFPVIVSPAGAQAVDPGGEVAVARAAAAAGTAIGLSSFASMPFEDVAAANPKAFFQLYWVGTRDDIAERVEHARQAGAKGLILTLDWSFASRRDWGSPTILERVTLSTLVEFLPMGLSRPGWALRFLLGGIPDLKAPNLRTRAKGTPTFKQAYVEWTQTPLPTWDDVRWLRELWGGEFMVKGVFYPDDARRAVDCGATAISVSNHGGNNLDGISASLRALPAVVEAVGDQVEVLMDGGIRRGSDVVKALAMGAKAVLVGRVWLWGLAAGGEEGVRQVLEILRSGIDEALIGLGHKSIRELSPNDLVIPEGFTIPMTDGKVPAARKKK
ncbi:pre-mycofactocin synthase MftD [Thermobifida fusca]|uniref:pre-mycofactocin synthase MftD n=1 Tax=Thermobifida fusca TaxID=2021 RepID=UPI001D0C42A9|nr:pre-mycofactocin synthase MftD [Thermobifida fusca]